MNYLKSMYCPVCFNDSLHLDHKGTARVVINDQHMDSSKILFNSIGGQSNEHKQMLTDLTLKIDNFFNWYSNFQNKEKIMKIELLTANARCDHHCSFKHGTSFSIIGIIVEKSEIIKIAKSLEKKYQIFLDLQL